MNKENLAILITKPGQLGWVGLKKWLGNLLKFTAPLALIYLGFVYLQVQTDGFQLNDFIPDNTVLGALVLWILNAALDFFRKLTQEQAYVVQKSDI